MKRKLFSVMLSAFALLLLMGAGPAPKQGAVMLAEEESAVPFGAVLLTDSQSDIEAGAVTPEARIGDPAPAVEKDYMLLVDGVPTPADLGKATFNGVTYVALAPMATVLDDTAQISWDAAHNRTTVKTAGLHLTAQAGMQYVEANGRYLYLGENIHVVNGRMMLPLSVIAECFDATVSWDAATGVVHVTRGSGAIVSGSRFYKEEDLFWLSRVIFAESGNQSLDGQMAVGNVVMNRVANPIYPNTVKGVIAQKNQFSTYRGGKLANRTPNASSVIAAKLVLDGGVVEETEGALYFDSTRNSWASRHRPCVASLGGHRFYL